MNPSDPIILLKGMYLPRDFALQTGLVDDLAVYYRKKGHRAGYLPPRFIGYYFNYSQPMAVCRDAFLSLDLRPPIEFLPSKVHSHTGGRCTISSKRGEVEPPYILVHDRYDRSCWLFPYDRGRLFVESKDPLLEPPIGEKW